jgi:ribosomal protein L4
MAQVDVYNMDGVKTGSLELSDAIFGIEPNQDVLHRAVLNYLANRRQGTHSTKTRSEVTGGGKKPYRQKGTGRARQVRPVPPSMSVVASSLVPNRVTTAIPCRKRSAAWP